MQGANSVGSGNSLVLVVNLGGAHEDSQNVSKSSKGLQEVIAKLAMALLKDGGLDESSPLGKMLAKAMAKDGKSGGGIEDIMAALDKLIHEKLGDNFGASADMNAGSGLGGGDSGGIGSGGDSVEGGGSLDGGDIGGDAGGQSDLTSQVLNGLAKSMLDDLLTSDSQGSTLSKDNMPMLEKVGQFMDDNKSAFPKPESGSWKTELTQSTHLDADDTKTLRSALDVLSQVLGKQQNDSGITGGGLGSPVREQENSVGKSGSEKLLTMQDLAQLLGGGPQKVSDASDTGAQKPGNVFGKLLEASESAGHKPGGVFGKLLDASHHAGQKPGGDDVKFSAELTAALLVTALLQSNNKPAMS